MPHLVLIAGGRAALALAPALPLQERRSHMGFNVVFTLFRDPGGA